MDAVVSQWKASTREEMCWCVGETGTDIAGVDVLRIIPPFQYPDVIDVRVAAEAEKAKPENVRADPYSN